MRAWADAAQGVDNSRYNIWIPLADSVGKADFLSQPDKSIDSRSKKKGDVSPFCRFYWVSCNVMDNVIAGFGSQSSQSQSVLKKKHIKTNQ